MKPARIFQRTVSNHENFTEQESEQYYDAEVNQFLVDVLSKVLVQFVRIQMPTGTNVSDVVRH